MISIRDADKGRLEEIVTLSDAQGQQRIMILAAEVLDSVHELSQQAPVIEPRIAPMSEAEKRICYPERYR